MGGTVGIGEVTQLAEAWAGRDVLVVGDVMLDEWRFTEAERLSREAPAPVLTLRYSEDAPGGAGNVAVNLARLGARPTLVAAVGGDAAGERLRRSLARCGVVDRTVPCSGYVTPVKRRLVAGDQIVVREDEGERGVELPGEARDRLVDAIEQVTRSSPEPVLVVCDHGLGGIWQPLREWFISHRRRYATVALDAHDLSAWRGLAPTLVTPSFGEAARTLELSPEPTCDRLRVVRENLPKLAELTGADVIGVTLDSDGSLVADRHGRQHHSRSDPASDSHTVGAGDVFFAGLTLALLAGAPLRVAGEVAQSAATATLAYPGTCVCDGDRLLGAARTDPADGSGKVVDAERLVRLVRDHRRRGSRIVFTNGCFDVLHRGHVASLEQARQLGDLLVVAVNSDASVRRLKGPERPVNSVQDRVAVLAAMSCVDLVVVFDQDSPAELIDLIRPEVYVKGGDYPPELLAEAALVRRYGGQVHSVAYVPDRSTSAIIERIRERAGSRSEEVGPRHGAGG